MGLAYVAPYWTTKSICDKFSADSVTPQGVSDSADCFLHKSVYRAGGVEASEYQVSYMTKIRFSQFACLTVSELTEITCEIVSRE